MRRRLWRVAVALVLAAGLAVGAIVAWTWLRLTTPFAGWEGESVTVDLPRGMNAGSMLARLGEAGVVEHPRTIRAWLALRGGAERLHAGEYRFEEPGTPLQVLDRLWRGDVVLHPVTVPEGLVLEEIAARIAEAGFGGAEQVLALLRDPTPILDLDPDAPDLEGYLFPETYHFSRGERPERVVAVMVERFRAEAGETYRDAAAAVSLTFRQAVTLASLIEKETAVESERERISRVFHNRLARGMPMQCDPTVIYALHRQGQTVRDLRYRHLQIESPWNTYRVTGLPPGPISNVGRASLQAAVAPAPGKELYFVASPEGGHRFSTTLAAHQQAVREWRRYRRNGS